MKRQIHLFNRLLARYKRYRRKLQRIESGTCKYSRKDLLIKRLNRLYERLTSLKESFKLATSGAALSMGLLMSIPNTGTAQQLVLKSDNPVGIINIEKTAKPVFVDWDNDGDLDLFVGGAMENVYDSLSNGVRYYQNTEGSFQQADSPFPLDLGTPALLVDTAAVSPAFIDLDGDSDLDAFLGIQTGHMLYFRNDNGAMVRVDGAENPFDGIQIGDTFDASPTFVDVDGDGDLDAVIGKYDGNLSYYQNEGGTFTVVSENSPFENINVTENATPNFADWDGDGDLDLLVGNKDGIIDYYINDNGVYAAAQVGQNPFAHIDVGLKAAPAVADIDNDSDLDLFIGDNVGVIHYYRNDGDTLINISQNTLGIDYNPDNSNLNHGFVDIDGDNDMDSFAGLLGGTVLHFENNGGVFAAVDPHPLDVNVIPPQPTGVVSGYVSTPTFADIDGDGDMDAFVGTYQDNILYFKNDGGSFTAATGMDNPFDGIDPGDAENIAFVDWDGDGDLDAFIGNKIGEVKYYQNDGGSFSAAAGPLDGVSFVGPRLPNWSTKPAFADIDEDGDMDAYIGTLDGFIRVFDNDGNGNLVEKTGVDNPFDGMDFGRGTAPDFGDIDGDGDVDLIVSNSSGLTFHFDNVEPNAAKDIIYNDATAIYPNPTTGLLQIEMPWLKGKAVIEVINLSGQLLQQMPVSNSPKADINLSSLPGGIYFIRVVAEDGLAVKKIMKR